MNFPRAFQRVAAVGAVLLASTLLASCGGGDQAERFVPTRVLAFGDESSVIVQGTTTTNGAKYTVNALVAGTTTNNCEAYPLWPQLVAGAYGFAFEQCRGSATSTTSRTLAVANATAAGVQTQVDGFLAAGGAFTDKDLVTVMAGLNDIVAQAQASSTEAEKVAAVEAAAISLAGQINRMVNAGARVLFATVPNVGSTPWGRADANRSALLTTLTLRFNSRLRSTVINDGRRLALVDAYESVRQVLLNPTTVSLSGFVNGGDALCLPGTVTAPSAAATTCTNAATSLVPGGDPANWLWADNLRLGPAGQGRIGLLAADRARSHPF